MRYGAFLLWSWIAFSTSTTAFADFPMTPDELLTTGQVCTTADPDFYEFRYAEKIPYCRRNVTTAEKTQIYQKYGVPSKCRADFTIDHFVPLALGGDNSAANLWPEHKAVKALRQNLEMQLYVSLRDGKMTQSEAIQVIYREKLNPPKDQVDPSSLCYHISEFGPN